MDNIEHTSGEQSTSTSSTTMEPKAGVAKNEHGLEYVRLVSDDQKSYSDIYLYGGCVTSYVVDGVDYLFIRSDVTLDGSRTISGGLSHCWPQFGPGGLQRHGFARNVNWTVASQTSTTLVLELRPNEYTKSMWDRNFLCTFTVTIANDKLDTSMKVNNVGKDAFDIQAALHSYLSVSSIDALRIEGSWKNREFLNRLVGDNTLHVGEKRTETRDVITIEEPYDRIYCGVNDPVLKDGGRGKSLSILNTKGYVDTLIWNPYGNEEMGYKKFVCVESVKYDPVALEGGKSWTGAMSLVVSNIA
mmetsp:Transcript_9729/g.17554  ORF Transcript_9729/g.17554 Transcript_9729/m.17554 type:complete len:301 (+) Transcript_9729:312-1214(+)